MDFFSGYKLGRWSICLQKPEEVGSATLRRRVDQWEQTGLPVSIVGRLVNGIGRFVVAWNFSSQKATEIKESRGWGFQRCRTKVTWGGDRSQGNTANGCRKVQSLVGLSF